MRLKEIKPGMVIHCKNDEEKKALLEEAERLGYVWSDEKIKPTNANFFTGSTIHFYKNNEFCDYKHIKWSDTTERTIEFSDLILPELTSEEVLQIISEICTGRRCTDCPIGTENCITNKLSDKHRVVEICQQWKSDHEKNEPEVEWVYRVFGAESIGAEFFETEEEAIKRCEELVKLQPAKKYERYEKVCRIKE